MTWGALSASPRSELTAATCPPRSVEFRDFLKTALDKNPETRPSASQLLEVSGSSLPGSCPLTCPCFGGGRQMRSALTWKLMVPHPAQVTVCKTIHSSAGTPWAPPKCQLSCWEGCVKEAPEPVLAELISSGG